jgi:hypothetical protein
MLKCDANNCDMSAECKCKDCAHNRNCGLDCGRCRTVTFRAGPVRIEQLGGAYVAVCEKDGFNKVIVGIGV